MVLISQLNSTQYTSSFQNSSTMQGLVADLMDDTDVNVPVQTDCEARTNQWNEIIAFHLFYAIDFNFRLNDN